MAYKNYIFGAPRVNNSDLEVAGLVANEVKSMRVLFFNFYQETRRDLYKGIIESWPVTDRYSTDEDGWNATKSSRLDAIQEEIDNLNEEQRQLRVANRGRGDNRDREISDLRKGLQRERYELWQEQGKHINEVLKSTSHQCDRQQLKWLHDQYEQVKATFHSLAVTPFLSEMIARGAKSIYDVLLAYVAAQMPAPPEMVEAPILDKETGEPKVDRYGNPKTKWVEKSRLTRTKESTKVFKQARRGEQFQILKQQILAIEPTRRTYETCGITAGVRADHDKEEAAAVKSEGKARMKTKRRGDSFKLSVHWTGNDKPVFSGFFADPGDGGGRNGICIWQKELGDKDAVRRDIKSKQRLYRSDRYTLRFPIGGKNKETKYTDIPITVHEDLLDSESKVSSMAIIGTYAKGGKIRYKLKVNADSPPRRRSQKRRQGTCYLDEGHRLVPGEGLKVLHVKDDNGHDFSMVLPQVIIDRHNESDRLKSEWDLDFNDFKDKLESDLEPFTDSLSEVFHRGAFTSRSHWPLMSSILAWSYNRVPGDESLFKEAWKWRRSHLAKEREWKGLKRRATAYTKEFWKNTYAWLRSCYSDVVVDTIGLKSLQDKEDADKTRKLESTLKRYRSIANCGYFHQLMGQKAFGSKPKQKKDGDFEQNSDGITLWYYSCKNMSRFCPKCGHLNTPSSDRELTCEKCNHVDDRDSRSCDATKAVHEYRLKHDASAGVALKTR